jgi:DNA-binding NarL/FixJ family response regulator
MQTAASIQSKGRILIVEDEELIAADLQECLTGYGYDVVQACSSGEEALAVLERSATDLLLLDIHLPGALDGIAVSQRARERWNLPTVFLSAYSDTDRIVRAARCQPSGYLLKPVRERELFATLEVAFRRKKAEQCIRDSSEWIESRMLAGSTGSLVLDPQGIVRFADHRARRLINREVDEIVGAPLSAFVRFADPISSAGAQSSLQSVERGGFTRRVWPVVVSTSDRGEVQAACTLGPLLDTNGGTLGTTVVLHERMGGLTGIATQSNPLSPRDAAPGVELRVAILSNDAIFRHGLTDILQKIHGIRVELALTELPLPLLPAIVQTVGILLIDAAMLGEDQDPAFEAVDNWVKQMPAIVLASNRDEQLLVPAMQHGLSCHLLEQDDPVSLRKILWSVANGHSYISPRLAPSLATALGHEFSRRAFDRLSARERQVLDGIRKGQQAKAIAAELHLSVKTVSTHRQRMLQKLGLKTNAELIQAAERMNRR